MPRSVYCDRCDGCGWYEGGPKTLRTTCGTCKGSGVVKAPATSGVRNPQSRKADGARRAALEAHDRACDRLISIAVKRLRARREAERPLREYGASPIEKILPELKASLRCG